MLAWSPDCINMKPVIKNEESFQESESTNNDVETLVLSKIEGSAALFCQRLKYEVKTIQESDQSSSDTEPEASVSKSGKRKKRSKKTPGKKYVCKLCGIEYRHSSNLGTHMRIHTGEAPYVCELCGRAFRRKDWLKLHSSIHMGVKRKLVKKFSCDQCGKKFVGSTALQSHLYQHKGERPFACVLCDKTFFSQTNLKRHQVDAHSDGKPFSCPVCESGFSRLYSLEKHMRLHTGERPYSCPECGKTFPLKYTLKMHLKTHSAKG
ncbi:zinc finger X-chromosomal protein [Danio rerio]|uniref:Zinc finger X-chromosomal protein n=1 Tax=Danio rerio TaxID=7955 RepID=A0AC58H340_DANRE